MEVVSSCHFMAGWLHIQIQLPVDTHSWRLLVLGSKLPLEELESL